MATLPANFTVLQVVPNLESGGAEQSAIDVARAITGAGGRALVASRGGRMEGRMAAAGGKVLHLPVHTKNPLQALRNAFRIAQIVRDEKVDLLHVRSRAPAFSTLMAARMTGTPVVATYHGAYPAKSPLKRWYNGVMTRGDLVIANSAFTRDHLLAQHAIAPDKVVTIPRGLDLARFDPAAVTPERLEAMRQWLGIAPADRRTRILLAGRLTRLKGQLVLVEAAARLKARGRHDFQVLMVGDAPGRSAYRSEIEAAIAEAELKDCVRLFGHCDDMPAAYRVADIVAVPSTVPETFGRTAVEPQALERPVVASALGGLKETVIPGETGWLAPAGDPEAWADALAQAIDAGPQQRAVMGAAGRKRAAELYSVEVMGAATLEAYARVLDGRR